MGLSELNEMTEAQAEEFLEEVYSFAILTN